LMKPDIILKVGPFRSSLCAASTRRIHVSSKPGD
jgi:hypothetical protein